MDQELTGEILKTIISLADNNMTMFFVTHEIGFAKAIADRIIFMDDGSIVEEGILLKLLIILRMKELKLSLERF